MSDLTISVIVPAFNAEATLGECLEALRRQTRPAEEIIVVDDGSTDRTLEIARATANVIPNGRRKGPSGARNTGASAATAEVVAFTDSDCVPPSDWLRNIAAAFADPDVGAVGGGYCCGADDSFWQVFSCEELRFRRRHRNGPVETLVSNNMACRKAAFTAEGGFPEHYPVCEDMLLSFRIAQKSKVLWLADNGVQHHFKTSLSGFLKHQYFFGAESTRFFIQNPELMSAKNHQGKVLHVCIALSSLSAVAGLSAMAFWLFGRWTILRWAVVCGAAALLAHGMLYAPLAWHLRRMGLRAVAKAYGVSLVRDLACGLSLLDGVRRAVR